MSDDKIPPTEYKYGNMTVRKASAADLGALEGVLARAFDDDPMRNWMCSQGRDRRERMKILNNIGFHLVAPFGEIYTTQDQTGIAGWIPPGKSSFRFGALPMIVTKGIQVSGIRRAIPFMISLLVVTIIIEKHSPHKPYWELFPLAVEPSLQGKGIGTALLQPILKRCDQDHMPAYLVTQMEKNVRFYEHRGFKVVERLKLPFGAPDSWIMWREPR